MIPECAGGLSRKGKGGKGGHHGHHGGGGGHHHPGGKTCGTKGILSHMHKYILKYCMSFDVCKVLVFLW